MKRPVRYQVNVIASMIKETLEDPGGRTFIILIFFDNEKASSGYIETPLKYYNVCYRFYSVSEVIPIMRRLVEEVNKADRERLARTYMKWLSRKHTMYASWAVHFWERFDGDFEGRAYNARERRETVFYGMASLEKILVSSQRGGLEHAQ